MVLNRRLMPALALAGTVSLTATACFGQAGTAGGEQTVVFANTGGVMAEVFKKNAYAELADKGIAVADESPNSKAKLTAMVKAGQPTWDVYYSTPYLAIAECGTMFEKIDYNRIDTTGLKKSQMSECGVPVINSSFVLVYNEDTYGDNPPTSWVDFYNPSFPGTRGIMNYAKDAGIETALLASGVPGDQLYPLDFDRAFATLEQVRSKLRFYDTGAQQTHALQSGEVDMMLAWPGRAYQAEKSGANLGVVWNQPLNYYDVLTIVKGAPHQDQAYELINALIGKKTQHAITERQPYGPANSTAGTTSDPQIAEFVNSPEKSKDTSVTRDNTWWAQHLEEATKRWTEWVNR